MEFSTFFSIVWPSWMLLRTSRPFMHWLKIKKAAEMRKNYKAGEHLPLFEEEDEPTQEELEKSEKAKTWLLENTTEIKRLIEMSGIDRSNLPGMWVAKRGPQYESMIPRLDNLIDRGADADAFFDHLLPMVRGYYKNEMWKKINLVAWLVWLADLPHSIVLDSGMTINWWVGEIVNFLRLVYWLVLAGIFILLPWS